MQRILFTHEEKPSRRRRGWAGSQKRRTITSQQIFPKDRLSVFYCCYTPGSSTPKSDLLRSYESLRKKRRPHADYDDLFPSPYSVPGFLERLSAEYSPGRYGQVY
eukprot:821086-Pelagomonas_calceolata.AAC.2